MKTLFSLLLVLLSASSPAAVPGDGIVGEWMGALEVGPQKLRLALHVAEKEDALVATLDSLDQGVNGLVVNRIQLAAGTLEFEVAQVGGSYTGTMNDDGSVVAGTWSQGGQELKLDFERTEEPFTLERPQEPKPPFPYKSEEVTFRNEGAGITLAGTFLTPKGEGPFPTVLFVSGSGPQDRNEELVGHKPFLVIADYLARRGIASLRYDDRGVGKSEGKHMASTVKDFASDADAGIAFLAKHPAVNKDALGILGHSEGALHGPMVAATSDDLDFLVLLAPPVEPLDLLTQRQARDIMKLRGVDEDLIKRSLKGELEDQEKLKDETLSRKEILKHLRKRFAEWKEEFTEEELELLQVNEAQAKAQFEVVTSPWFRSLLREDPGDYLKELTMPVLAIFAAKDVQVSAAINMPLLRKHLVQAGNKDFTIVNRAPLNHLFQHAETGMMEEYGAITETFDPETLETIGDWILERYQ